MKRFLRIFLLLMVLFLLALGTAAIYVRSLILTPYKGYSEPKKGVLIESGATLNGIAWKLAKEGVIRHPWLLKGVFLYYGTQNQSKAGEYVFDRPLSILDIYHKLMKGETQYDVVTVVEGSNVFDVIRILKSKGVAEEEEIRKALESKKVLRELQMIESSLTSLEGFLFPETYFLRKQSGAEEALIMMIRQFRKVYGDAEKKRVEELGMTTLQIITLASLIEKETGQKTERDLVSGVFHNRLQRSMLLQCDPTVIYALMLEDRYKGYIRRADLQWPSPYNTYVSPGLPPGPICNPGKASIHAALYPQTTDKLYFVSRNDGSHHFSTSLSEHNRAVNQYQRNQKRKPN